MLRLTVDGGSEGSPITLTDRENARDWPRKFSARVLEAGLVSYKDAGMGISFVSDETIARCMDSFVGKPLILRKKSDRPIGQGRYGHEKVTERNVEEKARGYISGWFRDGPWFCVEGIVFDDEAKDAIATVGACSCGYVPTAVDKGGEYHAIKYDETITAFSGEHLAIVDRPRYEGATIRLNSKQPQAKGTMKLKFWNKSAPQVTTGATPEVKPVTPAAAAVTPEPEAAAAARTNSADTSAEIGEDSVLSIPTQDGKSEEVTIRDLIAARQNAKKNDEGEIDEEDEIDVGNGRKAKMNAVIAAYNQLNPSAPAAKTNGLTTAAPATTPAAAPVAKPNHFRVLLNARDRANSAATAGIPLGGAPDSLSDRIARGKRLYGSAPSKN